MVQPLVRPAPHSVGAFADAPNAAHYRGAMDATTNAALTPQWLTPLQAAEYLGVGIDLIYDAIAAGGLKHTRLGHRTIRLRREWIDAWAEIHARQPK
jgi:excisionase family DNA binding protein